MCEIFKEQVNEKKNKVYKYAFHAFVKSCILTISRFWYFFFLIQDLIYKAQSGLELGWHQTSNCTTLVYQVLENLINLIVNKQINKTKNLANKQFFDHN